MSVTSASCKSNSLYSHYENVAFHTDTNGVHCGRQGLSKKKKKYGKCLVDLSKGIDSKDFSPLGLLLDFDMAEQQKIKQKFKNDIQGAILYMLDSWCCKGHSQWQSKLSKVLKDIDRTDLSQDLDNTEIEDYLTITEYPRPLANKETIESCKKSLVSKYQNDCALQDGTKHVPFKCQPSEVAELSTGEKNPEHLPILLQGTAGIGKTSMLQQVALYWSNGTGFLKKFVMVFFISIQKVTSGKIEDIICDDMKLLPVERKAALKSYLQFNQDKVLYLIDGLDEARLKDDNDIVKILNFNEHDSTLICSSRPQLGNGMKYPYNMSRFIEVKMLGFSDEAKESYIRQYFKEIRKFPPEKITSILEKSKQQFFYDDFLKVPLYISLICKSLNHQSALTVTKFCNKIVKEKLSVCWSKRKGQEIQIDFQQNPLESSVPAEFKRLLISIAQLAFDSLYQGKSHFSIEDIERSPLDKQEAEEMGFFKFLKYEDGRPFYCFENKLFQEYFAGIYMINERHMDQLLRGVQSPYTGCMLDSYLSNIGKFQMSFLFACGFSKTMCKKISDPLIPKQDCTHRQSLHCGILWLQMLFESQQFYCENIDAFRDLPIRCSSWHSVKAALYALQKKRSKVGVSLFGDGSEQEHTNLLCSLYEHEGNIQSLTFLDWKSFSEQNFGGKVWPHVKKLQFENCENVLDAESLKIIFPSVESI